MFTCDDKHRLAIYMEKLQRAIITGSEYPGRSELPLVYIKNPVAFDTTLEFSEPYYVEMDISLVNATNTSDARNLIYSNYERVIDSIPYILKNECRPISILKNRNQYYIANGKHRYLAHILLGKDIIPVSICEATENVKNKDLDMIEYKKKNFSDDGVHIAYPSKILDFYDANLALFKDVCLVRMHCIEYGKRYRLTLERKSGEEIIIKSGISAGNSNKSSEVCCELIKRVGFDIDMMFIQEHHEFVLENKYDANNIKFTRDKKIPDFDRKNIRAYLKTALYFDCRQDIESKIMRLLSILANYKEFNTTVCLFTWNNSGYIEVNGIYYYLVGSDSMKTNGKDFTNYIYIFRQNRFSESNLDINYLGRVEKGDSLYVRFFDERL